MEKIYSKCNPETLLQLIIRREDMIGNERKNFCEDSEYLQISSMDIPKGKRYKSHQHVRQDKPSGVCQEAWVVIKGAVFCYLYDLDLTFLQTERLEEGDCVVTFQGGHGYEGFDENSLVYEFKTGPYLGGDKKYL